MYVADFEQVGFHEFYTLKEINFCQQPCELGLNRCFPGGIFRTQPGQCLDFRLVRPNAKNSANLARFLANRNYKIINCFCVKIPSLNLLCSSRKL